MATREVAGFGTVDPLPIVSPCWVALPDPPPLPWRSVGGGPDFWYLDLNYADGIPGVCLERRAHGWQWVYGGQCGEMEWTRTGHRLCDALSSIDAALTRLRAESGRAS